MIQYLTMYHIFWENNFRSICRKKSKTADIFSNPLKTACHFSSLAEDQSKRNSNFNNINYVTICTYYTQFFSIFLFKVEIELIFLKSTFKFLTFIGGLPKITRRRIVSNFNNINCVTICTHRFYFFFKVDFKISYLSIKSKLWFIINSVGWYLPHTHTLFSWTNILCTIYIHLYIFMRYMYLYIVEELRIKVQKIENYKIKSTFNWSEIDVYFSIFSCQKMIYRFLLQ